MQIFHAYYCLVEIGRTCCSLSCPLSVQVSGALTTLLQHDTQDIFAVLNWTQIFETICNQAAPSVLIAASPTDTSTALSLGRI